MRVQIAQLRLDNFCLILGQLCVCVCSHKCGRSFENLLRPPSTATGQMVQVEWFTCGSVECIRRLACGRRLKWLLRLLSSLGVGDKIVESRRLLEADLGRSRAVGSSLERRRKLVEAARGEREKERERPQGSARSQVTSQVRAE